MWTLFFIFSIFNHHNIRQDCDAEKYIFEYISASLKSDIQNSHQSDTLPSFIKDILIAENIHFEQNPDTMLISTLENSNVEYNPDSDQVPSPKIYISPVPMDAEKMVETSKIDTIFRFKDLGTYKHLSNYLFFYSEVINGEIKIEILFNRQHQFVFGTGSQYMRHRVQNGGMRYVFKIQDQGCPELISKEGISYD